MTILSSGRRISCGVALVGCFSICVEPTSSPTVAVDVQAITKDVQSLNHQLSKTMPRGTLSSDVRRTGAAPKAIPILKRISADFDRVVSAKPATRPKRATGRQQVASMRAMAAGDDPKQAAQGHGSQLLTRWYEAGKEAGKDTTAQTEIVDDFEKRDRVNSTNSSMAIHTFQMSNSAATPAWHTRLQTLAADTVESRALLAIKRQTQAAAANLCLHLSCPREALRVQIGREIFRT